MYVGTLTADEMSFAGATSSTNYTHYLMNSYAKSNSLYWWGLSPGYYFAESGGDYALPLEDNGSLYIDSAGYDGLSRSRPTVSLKSSVQITGGNGTKENPYEIAS